MSNNPILDELYDVREELQAEQAGQLGDFLRRELQRETAQGHPVARIEQRRIRPRESSPIHPVIDSPAPSQQNISSPKS